MPLACSRTTCCSTAAASAAASWPELSDTLERCTSQQLRILTDIVTAAKISLDKYQQALTAGNGCASTHDFSSAARSKNPEVHTSGVSFVRSRHLPIFTGRVQPTIFGTSELNFCVRNGNRWGLTVIDTGRPEYINQLALLSSRTSLVFCFRRTCLRTE